MLSLVLIGKPFSPLDGRCKNRTNGPENAHLISGPGIRTRPGNQRTNGPVNGHLISGPSISTKHTNPK